MRKADTVVRRKVIRKPYLVKNEDKALFPSDVYCFVSLFSKSFLFFLLTFPIFS